MKIAILGGGWGAISTALSLTDPNNPKRHEYDITIYQQGWRIGGKGASGRGAHGRIEEHGLHVWMGFYENSFAAIQRVYEEVQPIYQCLTDYARNPFKEWTDAFKPHDYIVLGDNVEHQWKTWPFPFPRNDLIPGQADPKHYSALEYLQLLIKELTERHEASRVAAVRPPPRGVMVRIESSLSALGRELDNDTADPIGFMLKHVQEALKGADTVTGAVRDGILAALEAVLGWAAHLLEELGKASDELRRLGILLELGATCAVGMIKDEALSKGLDSLDEWDFRDWLRRHGASATAVMSAPVQALYDLAFGYDNGEMAKANMAAGVALRSTLRMSLTYRGAIFYKMQAGMGDTVFGPPFLVLSQRGVRFKFFHRVEALHPSQDGNWIDSIDIGVQATLKDDNMPPEVTACAALKDYTGYWPLLNVANLPCWPAAPNYDQLVQGEELRQRGVNLESFYADWQNPEHLVLNRGQDFDLVVLGISVGGLPWLCGELMDADPAFRNMVERVGTVRTQAAQLWLNKDLAALGWTQKSPVMDAYIEPLNTWADMSQLIDKETWPGDEVKNVAYFCGAMEGGIDPPSDCSAPLLAKARAQQSALIMAQTALGFLWPDARAQDNVFGLDFSTLVTGDAEDTEMQRFEAQYFRANIDPTERYVLSLAGTTEDRLCVDGTRFENLILTGDWVRNGFNVGCIEATTMAGMQASNAISGFPAIEDIHGLDKSHADALAKRLADAEGS
jgi:uncharacterized protein with NAD-binding domain and iron-sulfur cluster